MSQQPPAQPAFSRAPGRRRTGWVGWLFIAAVAAVMGYAAVQQLSHGGAIELPGWYIDYNAAAAEAETQQKPMLLFFSAEWCGACHTLHDNVLSEPDVLAYIDKHFVPVHADATDESRPGSALAQTLGVTALPTVMIVSPVGETLTQSVGARPKDEFMAWLARAVPGR